MKVVLRGLNQDALSGTLWEPAAPQNLQDKNHALRSVFRQYKETRES